MKIAKRLKVTADMVLKGSYAADIGTDHAYIPIYLVRQNISGRVVATDVRYGPLKRAKRNIVMYGLEDEICLKQGWGLEPVYDIDVNCAVLAGMGGYLICNILGTGYKKAESIEYFILQPMQFSAELRKYLYCNNYIIYDESLVKENGRIFEIMAVRHGHDSINDSIYYEIGKKLIEKKDPLLREFIQYKIDDINKIMQKIGQPSTEGGLARLRQCRMKLKAYEEVIECLQL